MEFSVLKKGDSDEIVFHGKYSKTVPAGGNSPADLVNGWTQGLEQILQELERDLATTLQGR